MNRKKQQRKTLGDKQYSPCFFGENVDAAYARSGVQVFRCLGVQVFRCSGVQVFRCSGVQVFGCLGVWVFRGFGVKVLRF